MKQTIFYLEGRGSVWIYHFFVYMLGGLYYILNKQYNIRSNDSILMDDTSRHVPEPTTEIKYPIKIHMKDILPYHREAFEIIKDKFELVEDLSIYEDYEIVSIYGETIFQNLYCDHPYEIFGFLRNLFLEKMPPFTPLHNQNAHSVGVNDCESWPTLRILDAQRCKIIPGKRVFITRKYSDNYHNNILMRHVINEIEIMEKLQSYGFEYIQLENLSIYEKIKLFSEAEVIMSSHSGGLVFTMFCNKETKIIEILNNGTIGFPHDHYFNICQILGIDYHRYSNINEDMNGNFSLEFRPFEEFLNSIHINKL